MNFQLLDIDFFFLVAVQDFFFFTSSSLHEVFFYGTLICPTSATQ